MSAYFELNSIINCVLCYEYIFVDWHYFISIYVYFNDILYIFNIFTILWTMASPISCSTCQYCHQNEPNYYPYHNSTPLTFPSTLYTLIQQKNYNKYLFYFFHVFFFLCHKNTSLFELCIIQFSQLWIWWPSIPFICWDL